MDPNNLAIVFGPNIYEQSVGQGVDPGTAMKYTKIVNEFTRAAVQWRMDTSPNTGATTAATGSGAPSPTSFQATSR